MKPLGAVRLRARVIGVSEPLRQCAAHHRHLPRCAGGLVGVEVVRLDTGWPCAWGIVGRPVSRVLAAAGWVELTRGVCPDGAPPGAASCIIGAAARWARKQGHPIVSYTLASEPGTSYRASGWVEVEVLDRRPARQWHCTSRARRQRHGQVAAAKRRWVSPASVAAAIDRGWRIVDTLDASPPAG
jgi:hypothetical protein